MTLALDESALLEQVLAVEVESAEGGVCLFGAGGYARAVHQALKKAGIVVHAFIVSKANCSEIENVPVIQLNDVADAHVKWPLWLAVFNRNQESELLALLQACSSYGFTNVRLPQQYFERIAPWMGWRYWLTDRREYIARRGEIDESLWAISDPESRRQLAEAIAFRLGLGFLHKPLPCSERQYFPRHVMQGIRCIGAGATFVDGGAYDGDTLATAAGSLRVGLAVAFEPDEQNFARLAENAQGLGFPVVCIPCGLSREMTTLSFSIDGGEAATVVAKGGRPIQCVSLDQCLNGLDPDYIKLDVEGHELAVLEGAGRLIKERRPAFAVAGYHRWDDLWRIPQFFRTHAQRYSLTYRAHEYNTFDGVFYAVPDV